MKLLETYYRTGPEVDTFEVAQPLSVESGYFCFGSGNVCFGRTSGGNLSATPNDVLYDTSKDIVVSPGRVALPFDPCEIIANLSLERYATRATNAVAKFFGNFTRHTYYALRPYLPLGLRSEIQRIYLGDWRRLTFPRWPVDTTVNILFKRLLALQLRASGLSRIPFIWFWPNGAKAAVIMTHDVEEEQGLEFCPTLAALNGEFNIPASFQFVPEDRYRVSSQELESLRLAGFEVNVQDLNHDGRLYWDLEEFRRRADRINHYAEVFGALGFRSGVLYRKQEWFKYLNFEYDMSVPNVAHLDPQRGGCCSVMPYFIGNMLELPVTTSQDHTIFHVLHDYTIALWRHQISISLKQNGLISFIVHPDYVIDTRARQVYGNLLAELNRLRDEENVWLALPGQVNRWWRQRSAMTLVETEGNWKIQGEGAEQACFAFAILSGDEVEFDIPTRRRSEVKLQSCSENHRAEP